MKKMALAMALASGFVMAQDKQTPMDPCGSPKEVYSKYMLDKCYKGYFDAIVESKRLAEDASKKVNDLEGRVKKLENIADDHERRLRALEGRPAPAPAQLQLQLQLPEEKKVLVHTNGNLKRWVLFTLTLTSST